MANNKKLLVALFILSSLLWFALALSMEMGLLVSEQYNLDIFSELVSKVSPNSINISTWILFHHILSLSSLLLIVVNSILLFEHLSSQVLPLVIIVFNVIYYIAINLWWDRLFSNGSSISFYDVEGARTEFYYYFRNPCGYYCLFSTVYCLIVIFINKELAKIWPAGLR